MGSVHQLAAVDVHDVNERSAYPDSTRGGFTPAMLSDLFRHTIGTLMTWRWRREGAKSGAPPRTTVSSSQDLSDGMHRAQKMAVVSQLACGLAHDVNNSIQVAKAAIALGGRRLDQRQSQECLDFLRHADEALDRAARLSLRLLTLAHPTSPEADSMDVNDTIGHMEPLLNCALGGTIRLSLVLDARAPRVVCPLHDFENVLLNLVVNSKDAMPAGGDLTISSYRADLDATHAGLAPGPYVGVDVTDTGTGMDPAVAQSAFEAFFTTKPAGRGTGLGLAMVKSFVDDLRGRADIISAPGRGTTVRMYLPAQV